MFPYSAQRGYDGMNLIEEAVIIEVLGIRMYAFGACVALGVLFAVISLCVTGRHLSFKKGTALLTAVISILSGILCSRVAFCLLNKELGHMTPLSFWPQVSGGGWSMFGLIGGVLIGGYISARIMKEDTGKVLDAVSLSVLPMIAAERMGESRIEDFDISRPLDSAFLKDSFLAVGGDEPCLATYYIAAAVAVLLFLRLAVFTVSSMIFSILYFFKALRAYEYQLRSAKSAEPVIRFVFVVPGVPFTAGIRTSFYSLILLFFLAHGVPPHIPARA